ncbi:unnamed protein product [Moneuplotes crassus]|uniref:Uncharacterized protein n=1 Tax=Euplotes crassus TaxID=5936 RepID=A0AAD2D7Y5_EUPCR|nr:unnamed protein product [Moneuplotes crassus]
MSQVNTNSNSKLRRIITVASSTKQPKASNRAPKFLSRRKQSRHIALQTSKRHIFKIYSPMRIVPNKFNPYKAHSKLNCSFSPAPSFHSNNRVKNSLNKTTMESHNIKSPKKQAQKLPKLRNECLYGACEKTKRMSKRVQQFRYHQQNAKKNAIKNLKKKYKSRRQSSLLTIATGTSSRYHNTTRQTEGIDNNKGKLSSFKLPNLKESGKKRSHRPKNISKSNISRASDDKNSFGYSKMANPASPMIIQKKFRKHDCVSQNSKAMKSKSGMSHGIVIPKGYSPSKSYYQSKCFGKQISKKPNLVKKLDDNLTVSTAKPAPFYKSLRSGLMNNKTTLESSNSGTTKRRSYKATNLQMFNIKDESTPMKRRKDSQVIEEKGKKLDEVFKNSSKQDSDRGKMENKDISNLTLEEYMLNYGRPYRNNSMKKIESVTTWRVVNEDPSESYITVDEEFEKETQNPISRSVDPIRQRSCENKVSPHVANSAERKSQIKLSILSALKKKTTHVYKKQRSTSRVLDDLERKISSPLLSNVMNAFFSTTKIQAPTGPQSIRMSSNASILYPIREENGAKMSIDEDILDEVASSSSISEEKGLRDIEKNSVPDDQLLQVGRRRTNIMIKIPKNQQLQLETNTPRTNRPSKFKQDSFLP